MRENLKSGYNPPEKFIPRRIKEFFSLSDPCLITNCQIFVYVLSIRINVAIYGFQLLLHPHENLTLPKEWNRLKYKNGEATRFSLHHNRRLINF
jgi:hypothetical protein